MSEHPEKERKIWDRTASNSFEQGITLENISLKKVLELLDWESYFDLLKLPQPTNEFGIIEKLKNEKIIIQKQNLFNITNLGGILLARKLEEFEKLSRKSIRVIQYNGRID